MASFAVALLGFFELNQLLVHPVDQGLENLDPSFQLVHTGAGNELLQYGGVPLGQRVQTVS